MLFHAPYQIFTRALKPHEIATGTSAFFLVRFTGATIGLVRAAYFCGNAFTETEQVGCWYNILFPCECARLEIP
jgi:hypothetical protein